MRVSAPLDGGMGAESSRAKIQSIQLLRFLAAAIVAYSHIAFAFAAHIGRQRGLPFDPPHLALSRVALFFLISGAVMVIASSRLFEVKGGWRPFIARRLIRIFPAYWATTLLLAGLTMFLGGEVRGDRLTLSLVLVPYWSEAEVGHPLPLLWPAWTLFYELLFYLVLASVLWLPRNRAVVAVSGVLAGLVMVGVLAEPAGATGFVVTRPILLLFLPGMALGLMLARGIVVAPASRALALIAAMAVIAAAPDFATGRGAAPLGWWSTVGIGTPALLVTLAVVSGPLPLPFGRMIDHLGDLSYSIFLWHVPVATFWIWFYQKAMPHPGPWGFLASCLALTLAVSHVSFRYFERPLADRLQAGLPKAPPAS